MAYENYYYITAGLPVAKASGQSPTSQVNTYYITAGLPVNEAAAGGNAVPAKMRYYRNRRTA